VILRNVCEPGETKRAQKGRSGRVLVWILGLLECTRCRRRMFRRGFIEQWNLRSPASRTLQCEGPEVESAWANALVEGT
jgi:hypothetical protein